MRKKPSPQKGSPVVKMFRLTCGLLLCLGLGGLSPALAQKHTLLQEDAGLYNALQGQPSAALNATTLNAAIAAAGSANKMIFLTPGTWTLNANVTVPSTRGLLIPKGSTLNRNGFVLTTQGPFVNLNNELSDGRNVKDCGAKVDGTTDDTAALNACLTAYAHVFIPQGTLLHSGTILLNVGNWLTGAGTGADAVMYANAIAAGMAVTAGSALHYTGAGDAVSIQVASPNATTCGCRIEHLLIYSGTGANGIHLRNITDATVNDVTVTGQTWPLTTNGFSNAALYLHMDVGALLLGDTRVLNSRFVYTAGYGIKSGPGNNTNANTIANNHIQGNALGGIHSEGQSFGWDVGGNTIEGNGNRQLYAQYASGWNIHGNYSEPPSGNNGNLWWFERGVGISITGNRLSGAGPTALPVCLIRLGNVASGFFAQGVTISNNAMGDAGSYAWCLEFAKGVTIRDNVAFYNIPAELGPASPVAEGLSYQMMTRDYILGQPVSIIESTPTLYGLDTTQIVVQSSTAETNLYSIVVPAHTLFASTNMRGALALKLTGFFGVGAAGPADFTVKVKYGGVILSTLRWLAVANSGGNYAFKLEGNIFGSMAQPGNQGCDFTGSLGAGNTQLNTVVDTGATVRFATCYTGTAGANMSVDQTLLVTVQMSVNSANVLAGRELAYVTRLSY